MPADTPWVKHIKLQSKLLSAFWGQPIFMGATVLLPEDYDSIRTHYPVIYDQGHLDCTRRYSFSPKPRRMVPGGRARVTPLSRHGAAIISRA